jgi:hypothetical protein
MLMINDLPVNEELDRKAMADVRGGIIIHGRTVGIISEGSNDPRPSPLGVPVVDVWPDGSRTPH